MPDPKVTIRMPKALKTTPSERQTLHDTFQIKLEGLLRRRRSKPGDDDWNVNRISTEIIVSAGARRPSKKAGKKK
jgi:hypothetical protein